MRCVALALSGSLLLATASSPDSESEKPKLSVKSRRIRTINAVKAAQGYGVRFDFTAVLEGDIDDPKKYYCLDEVWDWYDGTESVSEPDCDPWEEGTELKTTWYDSHYFGPGTYYVTFLLMNDDEIVLKAEKQILIK